MVVDFVHPQYVSWKVPILGMAFSMLLFFPKTHNRGMLLEGWLQWE